MQLLLSLASRQIWPQVLTAAHLCPDVIILLHSRDEGESKKPAERLKNYFNQTGGPAAHLEEVPSDHFERFKERLTEVSARYGGTSVGGCIHFTGGNKLMATAAYEWAKENLWRSCYLERGNTLFRFDPPLGGKSKISPEKLDSHLVRNADPIELLKAQLGESVVRHPGEVLTLNAAGSSITLAELTTKLKQPIHGDFKYARLLDIKERVSGPEKPGDNLEYAAAVVALKHGVPMVRRSVEFKSTTEAKVPESEIDLVFNWRGRLWMADCKAKSSGASKLRKLEGAMKRHGWNPNLLAHEFNNLKGQLADTEARLIKEDLQQISEMGGLLGSAFAIRMQGLPDDVMAFARSRRPKVEVVHIAEMATSIPKILT